MKNPSLTIVSNAEDFVPMPVMAALRDVMGRVGFGEEKLNDIVSLIATHLKADVCSLYVLRQKSVLELFATHGLNPDAVHKVRLKLGEGLVGYTAEHKAVINIENALESTSFKSISEVDEDAFKGFCSLPILRQDHLLGVIVLQVKDARAFSKENVEALKMVAMVLAEFLASGEVVSRSELGLDMKVIKKPTQISGVSFSDGFSIYPAVRHGVNQSIDNVVTADTDGEKKKLEIAIKGMTAAIDNMMKLAGDRLSGEDLDIFKTYQMFANDKGWRKRIEKMIEQGLTAGAAVQKARNEIRARFEQMDNAILKDKTNDIDDLSRRLISALNQNNAARKNAEKLLPQKFILVAESLNPAALFDYGFDRIRGIVLTEGSPTGHISIIARSLGIPVLGQCENALRIIEDGDRLLLDADNALAYINPSDYIAGLYDGHIENIRRKKHRLKTTQNIDPITRDGRRILLRMNAALPIEMSSLNENGAEGVGLFRTEIAFMGRRKYPSVAEQAAFYAGIYDHAKGKPITFRTLDIGGDKPLPYFDAPLEENPAMGWRAMRIIMDRPAVLRTQIRAFILGAKGRDLRVMIPFVSDTSEILYARQLIEMEFARAEKNKIPLPKTFKLGVMIEVPSLLWQLETLFEHIDFAAVGTNDLLQYMYAADSRSSALQDRYDSLSPAFLRGLKRISIQAKQADVEVSVCGEMAGRPLEAMTLMALGYDVFSMAHLNLGPVKKMLLSLDVSKTSAYLDRLLAGRTTGSLREKLMSFAKDRNVEL